MKIVTNRLRSWLESDRVGLRLAILGVALCAPSLGAGLFADDFAHRSAFKGVGQIAEFMHSPFFMFSFTDGDPENTRRAIESGFFPWWTSETILLNFWRPVAAATHAIDYWLWPDSPALMHAQSLIWFCATILVVTALFSRSSSSAWAAGLAGLLFVVDESHGLPVSWVANRNALVALFFGACCLLVHDRWRRSRQNRWLLVALSMLALSLHANEGGIATTGYLFAYALFLDRDGAPVRLASLVPYGVVVVIWRFYYVTLGFGALGSPTYVDPGATPLRFLVKLASNAPVLAASQIVNLPAAPFEFLPPAARLVHLGLAVLVVVVCLVLMGPLLRSSASARFFAVGALTSTVPASATFPTGRLLVFASIGGAGLVAEYLVWISSSSAVTGRWRGKQVLAGAFVLLHLVLAPVLLLGTAIGLGVASRAMRASYQAIEYPDDISQRTLYLIDPPNYFLTTYVNIQRTLDGLPVPNGTHVLASNRPWPVEMTATRIDRDTLYFAPEGGFPYLLFRDVTEPFRSGDRVRLEHLEVEILSVDDAGRALEVNYHFPYPLESEHFYWMRLDGAFGLEAYLPPEIGETHVFNRRP